MVSVLTVPSQPTPFAGQKNSASTIAQADVTAKRHAVFWLFSVTLLAYLLSAGSNFSSGDSYAELHVTASLVDHGWIDVPVQQARQTCAGWGCQGIDGRFYATHGIGYSLYLLPFYLPVHALLAWVTIPHCASWTRCVPIHLLSWSNCLLSAAQVALLCVFCSDLGYSLRRSIAVAVLFGFATLAWPYARFAFDVTLTGLLLLAATREAWLASQHESGTSRRWCRAGIWAALAILTRLPTLPAIVPLGMLIIMQSRHQPITISIRRMAAFATPLLAALIFTAWYNVVRFGSILNDGHAHNPADQATSAPWIGFAGMIMSPGKGVIWYSPVVLFALVALPRFLRRQQLAGLLASSIVVISMLPYAFVRDWYGGDAWGPRFVVPVLALLVLPAIELPELLAGHTIRSVLAGIAATLSILFAVAGQAVSYPDRLRAAAQTGVGARIFWQPAYSPLIDHLQVLKSYLLHPAWATIPVPRAQSFDVWWLNLWRVDGVPPEPVLLGATLLLVLMLLALRQLTRTVRPAMLS